MIRGWWWRLAGPLALPAGFLVVLAETLGRVLAAVSDAIWGPC